ncbi:hypothetical protein, partial [Salmonella enterica]|uniref:hypothetical protein n=1 Tax=Salmonella enterica TaxID=28901 RepID=UPI0020C1D322
LGGLLALEIARLVCTGANADGPVEEDDGGYGVEIVGLVLVDSVYPVWPAGSGLRLATPVEPEEPQAKNMKLARRAMK